MPQVRHRQGPKRTWNIQGFLVKFCIRAGVGNAEIGGKDTPGVWNSDKSTKEERPGLVSNTMVQRGWEQSIWRKDMKLWKNSDDRPCQAENLDFIS